MVLLSGYKWLEVVPGRRVVNLLSKELAYL